MMFQGGSPIICLLFTFFFGFVLPIPILGRWVTSLLFLAILSVNLFVLQRLPWWVITINLFVQTWFFFSGVNFLEEQAWKKRKMCPPASPQNLNTDEAGASQIFKHMKGVARRGKPLSQSELGSDSELESRLFTQMMKMRKKNDQ